MRQIEMRYILYSFLSLLCLYFMISPSNYRLFYFLFYFSFPIYNAINTNISNLYIILFPFLLLLLLLPLLPSIGIFRQRSRTWTRSCYRTPPGRSTPASKLQIIIININQLLTTSLSFLLHYSLPPIPSPSFHIFFSLLSNLSIPRSYSPSLSIYNFNIIQFD